MAVLVKIERVQHTQAIQSLNGDQMGITERGDNCGTCIFGKISSTKSVLSVKLNW